MDWANEFISESQWDYLTATMACVDDKGKIIKSSPSRSASRASSSFSPALIAALTEFGLFKESE